MSYGRKRTHCSYCGHDPQTFACFLFDPKNERVESVRKHERRCKYLTLCLVSEERRARDFEWQTGSYFPRRHR